MVTRHRPVAAFFTLPQLRVIVAWGAARPHGLGVRIMTDYEKCPEMAELFRYGSWKPVWFLNATQAGTIVMTDASGADDELGTVEEALARLLALEQTPIGSSGPHSIAFHHIGPNLAGTLRDTSVVRIIN